MKLLHINSYYGSSLFYKNLYDQQRRSGIDISVYVPVSNDCDTGSLSLGEYTTVSKNHGRFDRAVFQLKHRKIYNDVVGTYDIASFSLVHAHSLFSNGYIAYAVKRHFDVPYITAVRNTDVNVFFKYMVHLRKLGVGILREASRVVFLSTTYRSFVTETYVPSTLRDEILLKSEVIPNGIDDFWLENRGVPKTISGRLRAVDILTVQAG